MVSLSSEGTHSLGRQRAQEGEGPRDVCSVCGRPPYCLGWWRCRERAETSGDFPAREGGGQEHLWGRRKDKKLDPCVTSLVTFALSVPNTRATCVGTAPTSESPHLDPASTRGCLWGLNGGAKSGDELGTAACFLASQYFSNSAWSLSLSHFTESENDPEEGDTFSRVSRAPDFVVTVICLGKRGCGDRRSPGTGGPWLLIHRSPSVTSNTSLKWAAT